jgi:glycosyltransferase involved in cell wall biosynthesis
MQPSSSPTPRPAVALSLQPRDPAATPPRVKVLYALESYPHISHTYMSTEIACMRRFGVHVEVWSSRPPLMPFETDVPVHRGTLPEAIRSVAPGVVHVHWTLRALEYRKAVAHADLPLTVRAHHPHDREPRVIEPLHADPTVRRIYMFPQFASMLGPGYSKVRPVVACYDPELYYAPPRKDPRLVVRVSPCRRVKELELFIRVAARCPSHRFVLAVVNLERDYREQLAKLNRSLGSPVEILQDLQHADVSALVREAGTYLYTVLPTEEYSMPISISEALGAGCYVLARRSEGARVHVGTTGDLYDDEDEAVRLVQETTGWDDDKWRQVREAALDRARAEFASPVALRSILDDWVKIPAAV